MKHFEPYISRYCLHDTTVSKVDIKSGCIELGFQKGVYLFDRDGLPTEKTGPCCMKIYVKDLDADRIHQHMEIKRIRNSKIKEADFPDFLNRLSEHGLNIYLDYYSYFANSILLFGSLQKSEIQIRITEIDKIDFEMKETL